MPEDEAALAWEMLEWEVHHWRAAFGVALLRAQVLARSRPTDESARALVTALIGVKNHMEEAQLEAMFNPAKRRERPEQC